MRASRRFKAALLSLVAFLIVLIVFHSVWLSWLGEFLVKQQKPVRADMIAVLGGDLRGGRILKGAALARDGYAPRVLVSGSGQIYGTHESDLAVQFAVRNGFDEKLFLKLKYSAESTRDEMRAVARELRRLHVKKLLLVTSTFHTRRAGAVFYQEAPDLEVRVIGSPDLYFTPDGWWKNREGEKTFAFEWAKTIANWLGV